MSEEKKIEDQTAEELEQAISALAGSIDDEDDAAANAIAEELAVEKKPVEEEPAAVKEEVQEPEIKDGNQEPEQKAEPKDEEGKHPDNSAFARQRREIKELKEKLASATAKPEPAKTANLSADETVGAMVKVWETGVGDENALNAGIRKASSRELQDIYDKAVNGEYGDYGNDVIAMVAREMPMIQNRETRAMEKMREEQAAIVRDYEAEEKMAKEDFKHLAEENSPASAMMAEFNKSMIGSVDKETGSVVGDGALPENLAAYILSHPYVHHQLVDYVIKASGANSDSSKAGAAALQKQVRDLRSKLSKYETLDTPGGGTGAARTSTGGETADDIEKEILRMAG